MQCYANVLQISKLRSPDDDDQNQRTRGARSAWAPKNKTTKQNPKPSLKFTHDILRLQEEIGDTYLVIRTSLKFIQRQVVIRTSLKFIQGVL